MKKINWLLIPLLILSSCKKDSSVADASKEDSASFLGDPIIPEVDSAVYRDSIVNNAAMTKKVLKDGIMRVDEGNKIVREVDASAIPFNLGEAFSEGHDQLVLKITNFKGNEISAIVVPENKDMNIRINTIELSNEFLEDDKKVFIACCFNEEISELKKYFGDKAVIYKGGMSIKQKDDAEKRFMTDPKTTVFIGNIIAAGVGLTLTSSHICIFNSYDWVPSSNWQMMDRVHRIGQKNDVEVYFQLFSNTISEHMWETIIRKEMNIDKVIKTENNK